MNFLFEISTNTPKNDYEKVELKIINRNNNFLFKKFYNTIKDEKENIHTLKNTENWDKMKKIGNPYELIYTTYNKKKKNDSISMYIPISRSYFKMWEIYHNFDLFKYFKNSGTIFAHFAEGPGGFMESSYNYKKTVKNNVDTDIFYCITLKPVNEYIPDFNKLKKIFGENNRIKVNYGNLYNINDVRGYIKNFETNKAHIVTADGGFDYSSDFNGQEINSCEIIYSECIIALNILRKNGCFVCKVFDLFSITMVQLMYIMYESFEYIYIYKPETSRPANSEKYLVGMYYKDNISEQEKLRLLNIIEEWNNNVQNMEKNDSIMFQNIKVDNNFIKKLDEYNKYYIDNQIYYLKKTIELAKTSYDKDVYINIVQNQVANAVKWCTKYNVEINKNSVYYKKNN